MSHLSISLLGPPRIELDGVDLTIQRRKGLALLVYLALAQTPQRRDRLATLLWPGYDQSSARGNLRRTLSDLNRTLTPGWLLVDGDQVSVRRDDGFQMDVDQFQQCLVACTTHGHAARDVCPDCLAPLTQAAELYWDDFLTGFTLPDCPEFDDWQLFQTESLRRQMVDVLDRLVRGHRGQDQLAAGIAFARRLLAIDPLRESAHRQMMQLHALNAEPSAALAQYERCRQILADDLGMEPSAETTELFEQIRSGAWNQDRRTVPTSPEPAGARAASVVRHNLPPQLTPFVGRVEEVAEIARLLGDEPACRLLTLIGSGGVGKTRLALQAAAEVLDAYPEAFSHGVYFVPLTPVNSAEAFVSTIADVLKLPLSSGRPGEQLINYLSRKQLLLVLDNFEQLIPLGATDLLSEIILAAPDVKLLVTSRQRLNVLAEWGLDVLGLSFPQIDPMREEGREELDEEILAYDAVQLFLQQARRARPGYSLTVENCPDVVRICQLMEGIPLGIELTAAWLRMMSCREIVQEMSRSLDFLTTPQRDVPARHRSMRAVFDHSWQLLSEAEQAVFRKLSIFRGGFQRRAAERVADATLVLLSALVDKSLLRRTRAGRYEIHELLRQYAAERLDQLPEERDVTADRHSHYYHTFLQHRAQKFRGREEREALDEVAADVDNVRAAWYWAVARGNVEALGLSATGYHLFNDYRCRFAEGEAAFRLAVESLPQTEATYLVRAQLLAGQGRFSMLLGLTDRAESLLQGSIALLRQEPGTDLQRDVQQQVAFSLFWLGHLYNFMGNYAKAKECGQESLALYSRAQDAWGTGSAHYLMGLNALYRGDYVAASQSCQASIDLHEQYGDRRMAAWPTFGLGMVMRMQGSYVQATQVLEKVLGVGDLLLGGYALRELGYTALAQGGYALAKERFLEGHQIYEESGARNPLPFTLDGLGTVARLQGDYQEAERLYHRGLSLAQEIGEGRGVAMCTSHLGCLAYDRQNFVEAERLLHESLARYEEIGHWQGMAFALCHLGYTACALGKDRRKEARAYFEQSLQIAKEIGARPDELRAMVGWAAWLLSGASETDLPEKAIREEAVDLLNVVRQDPATEQETRDRAEGLLASLRSRT